MFSLLTLEIVIIDSCRFFLDVNYNNCCVIIQTLTKATITNNVMFKGTLISYDTRLHSHPCQLIEISCLPAN